METDIRLVWQTEQEILDEFHRVCVENNLKYSLAYGTLLGAIRHQGFIPWDDDIDVMMPRNDYEQLLKIWKSKAKSQYILQNKENSPDFTNNFSKIRKDHTTFIQFEWEKERKYHKGIFIDIFPYDRMANRKIPRIIQYGWSCINLLYTKEFCSGSKGIIGFTEKVLLVLPKNIHKVLLHHSKEKIKKYNEKTKYQLFCPSDIRAAKRSYPFNLFDMIIEKEFNGKKYMVIDEYDPYLKKEYGDYMKLPPESERVWHHHPILIDFSHNYEELEGLL